MFGVFFHPKSAARQRAVPELSVPFAAQASAASQVLEAIAQPREAAQVVEFKVRYRFAEYVRFAIPMAVRMQSRMRRAKGQRPRRMSRVQRGLFAAMLWPIFAFKTWRVGACSFRIDAQGIERSSRTGRLYKPWSQITLLRREAPGWIVGGERGAMPLPMRCLTAQDALRLEKWIATRRAAILSSGPA